MSEVQWEDDPNEMVDDDAADYADDSDGALTPDQAVASDDVEAVDEEASPAVEQPVEPVAQQQQPAQETHEQQLARAQAQHNAAAAYARIQENRAKTLEQRMNRLVDAIESAAAQRQGQQEPEEEEIPSLEENAVAHLAGKLGKVEKHLEESKEQQRAREQQAADLAEERRVAQAVGGFRQQLGEQVFDQGLRHLGQSLFMEAQAARPDLTDEQIQYGLDQQLRKWGREWMSQGLHPGEEYLKHAAIRGWQPPARGQQPQQQQQNLAATGKGRQQDPREEVRQQRQRQQAGRTISSAPGSSAPKRPNVAKFSLNATEEEWDNTVSDLAKKAGGRKPWTFREALAHKAVQGT